MAIWCSWNKFGIWSGDAALKSWIDLQGGILLCSWFGCYRFTDFFFMIDFYVLYTPRLRGRSMPLLDIVYTFLYDANFGVPGIYVRLAVLPHPCQRACSLVRRIRIHAERANWIHFSDAQGEVLSRFILLRKVFFGAKDSSFLLQTQLHFELHLINLSTCSLLHSHPMNIQCRV